MISKEEAIRILDPVTTIEAMAEIEYYAGFSGSTAVIKAMHDAWKMGAEALRNERPKGQWIKEPPYISIGGAYMKAVECSVCHAYFVSDGNTPYKLHPYCCECGADMRGEE